MANLTITNSFTAGTTIQSAQMNQDFTDVATFVNTTGVGKYQAGSIVAGSFAAGAIAGADLATAVKQAASINDGTSVVRGVFSQDTISSAYTATAYGDLSNGPDQVANVVLPTDGLITIGFRALWNGTHATGAFVFGNAAIFLGANQITYSSFGAAPTVSFGTLISSTTPPTGLSTTATGDAFLSSCPQGLFSQFASTTSTADETLSTTGQALGYYESISTGGGNSNTFPVGGVCHIWATAGTYTVKVQYKATTGCSLFVKNRRLWVKAEAFA